MASFNYSYGYPIIPVTGTVVTSGQFGDLKDLAGSHSIGLFDAQTYGVATGSGNGKDFFIGWSSEHTRDTMTKFWVGMQNPKKTWDFRGSEVQSFEVSQPQRLQNEKWVIGFDGTPQSQSLTYKKGGSYGVRITVSGEPTYRVFQRTLEHEIFVQVPEDCGGNCTEGCDDGVDCVKYTTKLAESINSHPELSVLGVRAKVVHSNYVAPTPNMQKWELVVCDEGDSNALAAVQVIINESTETKGTVSRIARVGSLSTYEVCLAEGETPDDFVPTESVSLAVCSTCPSGYTLVDAMQTLYVIRPITPTTDLDDDAAKDTWADGVGTTYGVADANATFVSNNGNGTATAKLAIPVATAIPAAINSDIVITGAIVGAYCDPDAAVTPIPWVETTTAYRGTRTLQVTLQRPDCDASGDRLEELEAFYADNAEVVTGSIVKITDPASLGCADVYQLEQWSVGCSEDDCLASDVLTYNTLQAFDGNQWTVVPVADTPDVGTQCGLEIEAGYIDTKFGNCSFDPHDYYNYEPIRLEVSYITYFAGQCELQNVPVARKIQFPISSRQSGEWLMRAYIDYKQAYDVYSEWCKDPRIREALDVNVLAQVDRSAFYKVYYLRFKAKRGEHQFDQLAEVVEAQIAFKEGEQAKAAAFENAVLAALGKFGVTLQDRK